LGAGYLPLVPSVYIGSVLGYDFLAGVSLAIFPAVVLDVVGRSPVSLTLYAFYSGIAVIATAYSTVIDGQSHARSGTAGLLQADGLLNLGGALFLTLVLLTAGRRSRHGTVTAA